MTPVSVAEWFADLAPDQALLFALPFLVAAIALIVDWFGRRWRRADGSPR
jgi:hypothetical protein